MFVMETRRTMLPKSFLLHLDMLDLYAFSFCICLYSWICLSWKLEEQCSRNPSSCTWTCYMCIPFPFAYAYILVRIHVWFLLVNSVILFNFSNKTLKPHNMWVSKYIHVQINTCIYTTYRQYKHKYTNRHAYIDTQTQT